MEEVGVLHGVGGEAPLPEVVAPVIAGVCPGGVVAVGFVGGKAQSLLAPGHGDQVHMVGHEAPAPDALAVALALLGEQCEVGFGVAIANEGLLAAVAGLGDVVGDSGGDDAGESVT